MLTDLERDLPTTRQDVLALRRARATRLSPPFQQLEALVEALPTAARRQRRDTAEGRPELEI